MLPLMMLQTTEVATFTPEPNSADLLPQDAIEPVVAFADILQVGLQPLVETVTDDGMPVPLAGNGLPPGAGSETGTATVTVTVTGPGPGIGIGAGATGFGRDGVLPLPAAESIPIDGRPGGSLPDTRALLTPLEGRLPASPPVVTGEAKPQTETASVAVQLPVSVRQPVTGTLQQPVQQETAVPRLGLDGEQARPEPGAKLQQTLDTNSLRPVQQTVVAAQSVNAGADLADTAFSRLQRPGPSADIRPSEALSADRQAAAVARSDALQTSIVRELPPQAPVTPTVQTAQIPVDSRNPLEMPLPQGPGATQSAQPAPTLVPQAPAPSANTATGAAVAQAQAPIDVPVRDTAWSGALGERVLVMANNQLQNAEIRLTPAELGPMRVQVTVDDGAANVTFHAQHAITREAIEHAMPRLRELLAENGLTLNQADVGDQAGPDVQQGNREADGDGVTADGIYAQSDDDPAAASESAGERPRARPQGLVDTFA